MIPPSFIQDLVARADIVELVGRHVQLKKAGINYKGLCPFHGEKSPSFIVSATRQTYHCFGCGAHGNAVGFLMEHAGLGFIDAVKDLAQQMGVTVPEDDVSPEERARAAKAREQEVTLTEILAKAATHWRVQLKASPRAIDYLKGRGLTGEIAARFGMGYAPPGWHGLSSVYPKYDDAQLVEAGLVIVQGEDGAEQKRYDRFRERIMFPIRNVRGEVIGFGGRVLDGGEPKYLNSPETPVFVKGRELYGLYEARTAMREKGYALVTEGYMDVVALAQLGFANAVATLGTACTSDHMRKLVKFTDKVVFSFDGDAAGRRAARRALEAVLPHATDTRSFLFLFLPTEHDPDSFVRERGAAAFDQCVTDAVPLSRQLMEVVQEGCDLTTAEGRAQMLAHAKPLFEQLPAGLLREQLLSELAGLGQLSTELVLSHWGRSGPRAAGAAPASANGGFTQRAGTSRGEPGSWADAGPPPEDPTWDGSPPEENTWSPGGGGGRRPWNGNRDARNPSPRNGERWSGRKNDRWRTPGLASGPRRAPPRTATLLDRAAWLLVIQADLWHQASGESHDLLSEQPSPYGEFFSALERVLHEHGTPTREALLDALAADAADDTSMQLLITRLRGLHDMLEDVAPGPEFEAILLRLQLQGVDDELTLLIESGELSPEATERRNELLRLRSQLKSPPASAPAANKPGAKPV